MAIYFINGTTLSDSTAIFLDSEQLTCAPDGFYSDGIIIREQVDCMLLPQTDCPSCTAKCNSIADAGGGGLGVYYLSIEVGPTAGASIITFNPASKPYGIIAELNGVKYNQLSSPLFGYLAGTANLPTYIGNAASEGLCPGGSIVGGPYTLDKFEWNGSVFAPIFGTESVTVLAGQTDLSAGGAPGDCIMVIPKPTATPSIVNVTIYGTCSAESQFTVNVGCAAALPSFRASNKVTSIGPGYCDLSPTIKTYYVAKVNNSDPYPFVSVNDWVFQDQYGQTKCLNGFYRTNNVSGGDDTIEVANGIIVNITTECP